MELSEALLEFCDLYGVELSVLHNYLDSLKLGDNISAELYYDIIRYGCSNHNLNDMENDLRKLIKLTSKNNYEA